MLRGAKACALPPRRAAASIASHPATLRYPPAPHLRKWLDGRAGAQRGGHCTLERVPTILGQSRGEGRVVVLPRTGEGQAAAMKLERSAELRAADPLHAAASGARVTIHNTHTLSHLIVDLPRGVRRDAAAVCHGCRLGARGQHGRAATQVIGQIPAEGAAVGSTDAAHLQGTG